MANSDAIEALIRELRVREREVSAAGKATTAALAAVRQVKRKLANALGLHPPARVHAYVPRKTGEPGIPYGWKFNADRDGLEPHPKEQVVVAIAKGLRADGYSLREIAAALDKRDLRTRKGLVFAAAQVSRLLSEGTKRRRPQRPGWHAQRRAALAGVVAEYVDPARVFERDEWKCYLCGCRTPKDRRGTRESDAPELDHVVPLSRGGPHTYENVRCCCRACNVRRANARYAIPALVPPIEQPKATA